MIFPIRHISLILQFKTDNLYMICLRVNLSGF